MSRPSGAAFLFPFPVSVFFRCGLQQFSVHVAATNRSARSVHQSGSGGTLAGSVVDSFGGGSAVAFLGRDRAAVTAIILISALIILALFLRNVRMMMMMMMMMSSAATRPPVRVFVVSSRSIETLEGVYTHTRRL